MKQVALVGLAPSTHDLAPWDDPEWEIWGLPWDAGYWANLDIGFEMHDIDLITSPEATHLPRHYIEQLNDFPGRLFMQQTYEDVPKALPYPLDAVQVILGDYFGSSFAYMAGYALLENLVGTKIDRVGIWGFDMELGTEHGRQKPNAEYIIGFMRGRGMDVYIPEESNLCKFESEGVPFGPMRPNYVTRYGYLGGHNAQN